jgi:hypothetical protein
MNAVDLALQPAGVAPGPADSALRPADVLAGHALAALLRPISLDELCGLPDLQTRVDRKYMLPEAVVALLIEQVHGDAGVLVINDRASLGYESVYFDTDDLACYHAAAHGRRRRFKVRTRTYLETGVCFLEVKTVGGRGQTIKQRGPYPFEDRGRMTGEGRRIVADLLGTAAPPDLRPVMTTTYRRSTLVDMSTGGRVTIDADFRGATPDERAVFLEGHVIVETKSPSGPTATDRWLWGAGCRPVRLSKYAVALAALDPQLPANKWARTLRRWYG